MEVSVDLNVSKEDFFDFLYESVINDIKESTGKIISRDKVAKGYTYEKNVKNNKGKLINIKITIMDFTPCESYIARVRTEQGENRMSYLIDELGEEKINVTYKEEYLAPSIFKEMKFKVLNFFHKKTLKEEAESNLIDIETYIKNSKVEK